MNSNEFNELELLNLPPFHGQHILNENLLVTDFGRR
jgi:hypothetical protein